MSPEQPDILEEKIKDYEHATARVSAIAWRYLRGIGKNPEIERMANEVKDALGAHFKQPEGY